jgi:hypothetical protein
LRCPPPKKALTESLEKKFGMCQSLHWPQAHDFFGGGIIDAILHYYVVNMPLRTPAHHCKRLSPLLAAPAVLLLSQGQAKAVLTYNIFESSGAVIVQTSGSLDLTGATSSPDDNCGVDGAIVSSFAIICTGPDMGSIPAYAISGPASFIGTAFLTAGSGVSGTTTGFSGGSNVFVIDPAYNFADPIVSSATFNGTTLASLGFTTSGLIGTWSFTGTSESIQVVLGNPPAAAVPGPLPLFGAAAAFGWSRRLSKRIATALITPPQA